MTSNPFKGEIFPVINSNMKLKDLIPLFEGDSIHIITAEERNQEVKKARIPIVVNINHDQINIDKNNSQLRLFCETLTKYLEYSTILMNP